MSHSPESDLSRWVAAGLLEREQADAITAFEAGRSTGVPSLVAEGLGYVGGVLVLVAAGTLTGRFWAELGVGGRVAVALVAAVILLGAGLVVPRSADGAGGRLRAVTWLLSVGALAGAAGLVADQLVGGGDGEGVVLLAASVTALYAAELWRRHRTLVQQAAVVAALAVAAGSAAALLPHADEHVAGLAVWGLGVVWLLLALGEVVARVPGTLYAGVALVVGSLFAIDGGTGAGGWGSWLALGSALALVVAGVAIRDLVVLGVGAVATLFAVPWVFGRWFPDTSIAPFVLLGAGAVLVVGAVVAARRRSAPRPPVRDVLGPRDAVAAAAVAGIAVAAAVVALGS
jgi:hypothetical protein